MQPFLFQIAMFFIGWYILNKNQFGIRYYCLFSLPFYSTTLAKLSFGSTYITAVQVLLVVLLVRLFMVGLPLSKKAVIKASIMLLPFFLSLLYNAFFFEPIDVWEINRDTDALVVRRESLNFSNFTQLIYIFFGAVCFIVFSSLNLDYLKTKQVIEWSMLCVAGIGLFQVAAYYLGINTVFRFVFSNQSNSMADQVFSLWGLKRISTTFSESSYFAQYAFYTLTYYLHQFGYREFLRSKTVLLLAFVALISTSTTAYWGLLVLSVIMFVWYSSPSEKMRYYIFFILITPIAIYFGGDLASDYWGAKEGSSNVRVIVSWVLAWDDIYKSPLLGYGFGTSKPLFIYTQMLHAIGAIGVFIFLVGVLLWNRANRGVNLYLFGVLLLGIANFELGRSELWVYFGLLFNPFLRAQGYQLLNENSTSKMINQAPTKQNLIPPQRYVR